MNVDQLIETIDTQDFCQWSEDTGNVLTNLKYILMYSKLMFPAMLALCESKITEEEFLNYFVKHDDEFAQQRSATESQSD